MGKFPLASGGFNGTTRVTTWHDVMPPTHAGLQDRAIFLAEVKLAVERSQYCPRNEELHSVRMEETKENARNP